MSCPMRGRHLALPLLIVLILAGCAGSRPHPPAPGTPATASTVSPQTRLPERPLPYPVDLPLEFLGAIERGTRTTDGLPGPDYWQQHAAYRLTARLFPDARRLEGTARITYTNNAPIALSVVFLELTQNLHAPGVPRNESAEVTGGVTLTRVAAGGQVLSDDARQGPRYGVDGTLMGIVLPTPLSPGASVDLEIDWTLPIPQAGAGERMGYSGDNLFFLAYWYPRMRVFDDVIGWHLEPFLGQAEFYHGFDDFDVTIEAPEGWIVMATGSLQNAHEVLAPPILERLMAAQQSDEPMPVLTPTDAFDEATRTSENGYLRWHFTAEQVRDVAFTATRDTHWETARTPVGDLDGDGTTDHTVIHTFYRDLAPRWKHVTRYQQHAISFLSAYTGFPYPWPHMTAVEGSAIIGGGMEFPMMTLMGDYNARGDSALYYVTAHELAHMWIPMIVGSNERAFSWIDEGSTTFAENQARADFFPGPLHFLGDQNNYIQTALSGMEGEIMRPSNYHASSVAFLTASYTKPASLLRALRGVLGDEVFLEAYRAFIHTWAFKHPYPYDLFNTFERVSGQDLDWFWRTWYFDTWTLDQAIGDVVTDETGVTVTIDDFGRVPMPVRLRATYAGGRQEEVTLPVEVWLEEGRVRATATLPPGPVTRVEIDPDRFFPDVDRSNNVWEPGD